MVYLGTPNLLIRVEVNKLSSVTRKIMQLLHVEDIVFHSVRGNRFGGCSFFY
jgi:hypothetical protein